jgi:UDP:flavonoid glycosyltransferase YjiC (YdhE family)
MKVLVSTTPHLGHFLPLAPVARALDRRGHDVVVAAEPAFAPAIEREGLRAVAVGRDLTLDDLLAVLPDIATITPEDQDSYARPRVFVELRANSALVDLRALVAEWQPDLVVRDGAELASWAIAEQLDLPHVTAGAADSAAEWDRIAGPWIEELGRRVGIAALRASSMHRYALLDVAPAGFHDWSDTPTARVYRPDVPPTGGGTGALDSRLGAFDGAPLVYTTLGTEFYDPSFMQTMIAAAMHAGRNVVATIGRGNDPAAVAPADDRVLVVDWLPQDELLDRLDVVLCHGGTGTVTGPLVHGVPLVVVPRGADQFANAARVGQLGAGIAVPPEQQDTDHIDAALEAVLDDPRYRVAARAVAEATARLPGLDEAVDFLEELP